MAGKFEFRRADEVRAYGDGRRRLFGVGPANPHASTSRKFAAFQAGERVAWSRDSTEYGAWRPVAFNGSTQLDNATNTGMSATNDYSFAVAFRIDSLPATLLSCTSALGPTALATVTPGGAINLSGPANGTTFGFVNATVTGATVVAGQEYVLHAAVRANPNTILVWLNGVALGTSGATWFGTTNLTPPTAFAVGGLVGGSSRLVGRMGLAWFGWGQYVNNPAMFWPPANLGATLAGTAAQPNFGFGGDQTAAGWNAGINQGSGNGAWAMTGAVTAVNPGP